MDIEITRGNREPSKGEPAASVVPIREGVAIKGQGKNRDGLTAKQEAFAQAVANGLSLSDAYRAAYDCAGSSVATVNTRGHELAKRSEIAGRIEELVAQKREARSLDSAAMLSFIRERLLLEAQNTHSKPADRLKALELMGKLSDVGAFRERIVEEQVDTKSALELEREIKRKLEKILAA